MLVLKNIENKQLSQYFPFPFFRLKPNISLPTFPVLPSYILVNSSVRCWVGQELQVSANFFCPLLLAVFLPLLLGSYCSSALVQDSPSLRGSSHPSVRVSSCDASTAPFDTTLPLCLPFLLVGLFTFFFLCPPPTEHYATKLCCCSINSAVRLKPINSSGCYIF